MKKWLYIIFVLMLILSSTVAYSYIIKIGDTYKNVELPKMPTPSINPKTEVATVEKINLYTDKFNEVITKLSQTQQQLTALNIQYQKLDERLSKIEKQLNTK